MSRPDVENPTHKAGTSFDPSRTAFERLRVAPTERLWLIELGKVLDGVRDHVITHLGDAGDYVEDIIEQAEDPALSRALYLDALERQVAQWCPGRDDAWMIDLLRRYAPRSGFPRLVEMFRQPGLLVDDSAISTFSSIGLRLRALHALERYFPAAPLDVDVRVEEDDQSRRSGRTISRHLAYRQYVDILKDHLMQPQLFSEYAFIRLLDLFELEPSDQQTWKGLEGQVSIGAILRHYLSGMIEANRPKEILSAAYQKCLELGKGFEEKFRFEIFNLGKRVVYERTGPMIFFPEEANSRYFKLDLTEDLYKIYYGIYIDTFSLEKLESLLARWDADRVEILYENHVAQGKENIFRNQVALVGAKIDYTESGPEITDSKKKGKVLRFRISQELRKDYESQVPIAS